MFLFLNDDFYKKLEYYHFCFYFRIPLKRAHPSIYDWQTGRDMLPSLWSCSFHDVDNMRHFFKERLLVIALLIGSMMMLSSCNTIEGMLRYITSLPGNLFNAIAP